MMAATAAERIRNDKGEDEMSGPIVRTGTTPEYWENWDKIFGDQAKKQTGSKKTAAKATAKKAAAKKGGAKKKKK